MLRSRDITATVVSAMVGAGIFLAPGLMLRSGATPTMVLVLFVVGGIIAILGALTIAELASAHPGNGGPYRYLRANLGRTPAFLFNWSRFWVMQTGALAILSLTCIRFAGDVIGVDNSYWEAVAAIGLLAATAALNARGLWIGAWVQRGLTVLKVGALLAIVVGVAIAAKPDGFAEPPVTTNPTGIGGLLLLAIFAYGGWTQMTFLAGEVRDPKRFAAPLVVGVVIATALYLISIAAMFLAMPDGTEGRVIIAEAAGALWGDTGRRIVAAAVAVAVLGGLHTMTLTGPRLYAAAAENGQWWRPFAKRNATDAPATAIWLQAEWAALLVALSQLSNDAFLTLIGSLSVAIWVFHVLTAVAWFRQRRRADAAEFRTPGGPIVAGAFLAATTLVVGLAVWNDVQFIVAGRWGDLQATWAVLVIGSGAVALVGRHKLQVAAREH